MRQVLDGVDGELGAGETGQGGLTVSSQLRITLKPFIPQEIGEKPDDANEMKMLSYTVSVSPPLVQPLPCLHRMNESKAGVFTLVVETVTK